MSRVRSGPLMLLVVLSSGCTTWQSVRAPQPGAPSTALEGEVRVTRADGGAYLLRDARIETDSVIGTNSAGARIAVATKDVSTIERRTISATRTTGLIGGSLLAVYAVVIVAVAVILSSTF